MTFKSKLCLTILVLLFAAPLRTQTSFDVVSVKPNLSGNPPSDPRVSPGRFSWTNATLRQLIQVAYDRRPHQLIGIPDWADTSRFDIVATSSPNTSRQQMNVMLQSLLADRFDLTVHRDSRELPVYALVPARRDGRLGPGIRPSTMDCESTLGCAPQMGLTRMKATGLRLTTFASALTRLFDRSVVDRTGISGTFDIELSWTPDPAMLPNGVPAPNAAAGDPSIFTALEEQLGLKLVSARSPVDILVIDRISRPKPD